MTGEVLDVEEPLADIEFPSIEEVHAQDKAFAGDVNALFDSSEPVVTPSSQILQSQLGKIQPQSRNGLVRHPLTICQTQRMRWVTRSMRMHRLNWAM